MIDNAIIKSYKFYIVVLVYIIKFSLFCGNDTTIWVIHIYIGSVYFLPTIGTTPITTVVPSISEPSNGKVYIYITAVV